MNIDPLAEEYSYQSPYNFAENRVIDGRELEGLEWVDAKNNQVYDPKLNDGKGGFTESATSDHRNLAKSLNQTNTGRQQFNTLVNSTTPVETVLNEKDKPVDEKGAIVLAETNFSNLMDVKDLDTGKVEDVSFTKATITFFMGNIDKVSANSSDGDTKTKSSMYGTAIPEGFNFSDIIGAIFGHEIGHANKNNVLIWAQGGDHEAEPTKIHTQIINETVERKSQ